MTKVKVAGKDIKQAMEQFGSLHEANQQLRKENLDWEQKNSYLKNENSRLNGENATQTTKNHQLSRELLSLSLKQGEAEHGLKSITANLNQRERQYELFCGFMAMVIESPSVDDSIQTIIGMFEELKQPGWHLPKSAAELRSFFVRTVMGDHLKSFHCDVCGYSFITNGKPKSKFFGNGYTCPACQNWHAIQEDDSFLRALVSPEQIKNTVRVEEVVTENEQLAPLKGFNNAICEICNKPINEWKAENVDLAASGIGFGHVGCWNSAVVYTEGS